VDRNKIVVSKLLVYVYRLVVVVGDDATKELCIYILTLLRHVLCYCLILSFYYLILILLYKDCTALPIIFFLYNIVSVRICKLKMHFFF
jgi:hypothetical protein